MSEPENVWRNNLPELVLLASVGMIGLLLLGGTRSLAQRGKTPGGANVVGGTAGPPRRINDLSSSVPARSASEPAKLLVDADVRFAEWTTPVSAGSQANPIDGQRAYEYLKQICAIGPRISGTPGMQRQQQLLAEHFDKLGGTVAWQRFRARHPRSGQPVPMANLLVHWHADRQRRILLCAHYDTRPLPDRDRNPGRRVSGRFLGANDGASGVALLMELGHQMPQLDSPYGVDFLLVDGEELVYGRGDPYFLGSEWFARQYVQQPLPYTYRWGVVLDMVADADLQIFQEKNSLWWRDTRPLVEQIWSTAARLGVKEFVARPKHDVRDDHVKLRNIAKIPTCNIIDFDFGANNRYWHTEADTPSKCSGESLAKVGWVVYEWLRTTP